MPLGWQGIIIHEILNRKVWHALPSSQICEFLFFVVVLRQVLNYWIAYFRRRMFSHHMDVHDKSEMLFTKSSNKRNLIIEEKIVPKNPFLLQFVQP